MDPRPALLLPLSAQALIDSAFDHSSRAPRDPSQADRSSMVPSAAAVSLRDRLGSSGWIYGVLCACMLGFSGYHVLMKWSLNNHGASDSCHMFRFGFWRDFLAAMGLAVGIGVFSDRDGEGAAESTVRGREGDR